MHWPHDPPQGLAWELFMIFKLLYDTGKLASPPWTMVTCLEEKQSEAHQEGWGHTVWGHSPVNTGTVAPRVSPLPRGSASSFTVWPKAQDLVILFPVWAMA